MKKLRTSPFSITFQKNDVIAKTQCLCSDPESLSLICFVNKENEHREFFGIGWYLFTLVLFMLNVGTEISATEISARDDFPTKVQQELDATINIENELDEEIKLLQQQKLDEEKKEEENLKAAIKEQEDLILKEKAYIKAEKDAARANQVETNAVILAAKNKIARDKKIITELTKKKEAIQAPQRIQTKQGNSTLAAASQATTTNASPLPPAPPPVPTPAPGEKAAASGGLGGLGNFLAGFEKTVEGLEKTVGGVVDQASNVTDTVTNTVEKAADASENIKNKVNDATDNAARATS
ncbi:MAG: hypothetical protein V4482_03205 [Pseudomonadota bacterium]